MVRRFQSAFLCRAIVAVLLCAGFLSAAEVEALLDRETVTAGNAALLTLKVTGSRSAQPEVPQVEKLIIQPRGRSQQLSIVNGVTSQSVIHQYAVGSNTPGDYQIPPITVLVDGKNLSTLPLKLKVLDDAAARPPAGMPKDRSDAPADDGKRFGFLTVEPASSDRKFVYVGEIAPVRIRAWIPEDARAQLRSGIKPEGMAFTLHNVSERPQQEHVVRDGKRYLVVTWYGGISATKAGKYPASLSLDATVAVRDTSAPRLRRNRGGPFGDPLFDDILDDMSAPMIEKDVTLKSDDQQIEVRPLPAEGRPEGFTGAVGRFKFESVEIPAGWKTGEPQAMGATISGTGNFALLKEPQPSPADAWKTYPGKSEFTPQDGASFSGSKRFHFSAVPRKGGDQRVMLKFSFFDPSLGAYIEIVSPEKAIRVAGADVVEMEDAAPPAEVPAPAGREGKLAGQQTVMTAPGQLVPLVFRPAFIPLLGTAGGLCLLGGLLGWLRKRRENPQRLALAAMEMAVRESLAEAGKRAAAGDVPGFFEAARRALQERLGGLWRQPAQAITLAEVLARLPADSPVARFFREADLHAYGRRAGGDVPHEWRALLDAAMASIPFPDR